MRPWVKYSVSEKAGGLTALDHFAQMGGYIAGSEYSSRKSFFATHLDAHDRLLDCERYLAQRVTAKDRVLSVASGRCATELRLQERIGCSIVCSEREEPPCLEATRALFPELEFCIVDALDGPCREKFDAVISLSLIYTFDDCQLSRFFDFVAGTLKPGGKLYLDFAGPPDNVASRGFHDLYLPVEAAVAAAMLTLKHRRLFGLTRSLHGFRRTREDVVRVARDRRLAMSDYWEGSYTSDLERSLVLQRLSRATRTVRRGMSAVGRLMPYVRIATFRLLTPYNMPPGSVP